MGFDYHKHHTCMLFVSSALDKSECTTDSECDVLKMCFQTDTVSQCMPQGILGGKLFEIYYRFYNRIHPQYSGLTFKFNVSVAVFFLFLLLSYLALWKLKCMSRRNNMLQKRCDFRMLFTWAFGR